MQAPRWWQKQGVTAAMLLPLAWGYRCLFEWHQRWQMGQREGLPLPIVVVGNVTAGGSGKTPVVEALTRELTARGWRVGIVSRGYRGRMARRGGVTLASGREPETHGDEPTYLAQATGVPVAVGRDRAAAVRFLARSVRGLEVVVADDGLQHTRLPRVAEVVVVDPEGLGNGWLLPAGPLREPLERVMGATAVVVMGAEGDREAAEWLADRLGREREKREEGAQKGIPIPVFAGRVEPVGLLPLSAFRELTPFAARPLLPLSAVYGRRVAAVAGIARPERFFSLLRTLGAEVVPYPFPDHHPFRAQDLPPRQGEMWRLFTTKDAVKCARWAEAGDYVLVVRAQLPGELIAEVERAVNRWISVGGFGVPFVQG
ncbi:MAG: tetraacyldisaccharide 4'-kinase [Hydrogenophilus sp.]|nr:tetraacyldisaccharide 4'-kinase [Hydrogenophilus sp.]